MTSLHRTSMRWQRAAAVIALGALVACHHPATFNAVTPTTQGTVYDCITREMTRLKYQVTTPDAEARVRLGDRAGDQHGLSTMGNVVHDRLLATVTTMDSASVRLGIVASTQKVVTFLNNSRTQTVKTTDAVRADAMTVMNACARIGPGVAR
jgi:hypothetical protein